MNIGMVAAKSGVSAKTIRYYESIGLIPPASRSGNGYRCFTERDVQTLRFVQRARSLGFAVEDVSDLLELWRKKRQSSEKVRTLARRHMDRMEEKILELESIVRVLGDLIERCEADDRPNCPILEEIEREPDHSEVIVRPQSRGFTN